MSIIRLKSILMPVNPLFLDVINTQKKKIIKKLKKTLDISRTVW